MSNLRNLCNSWITKRAELDDVSDAGSAAAAVAADALRSSTDYIIKSLIMRDALPSQKGNAALYANDALKGVDLGIGLGALGGSLGGAGLGTLLGSLRRTPKAGAALGAILGAITGIPMGGYAGYRWNRGTYGDDFMRQVFGDKA